MPHLPGAPSAEQLGPSIAPLLGLLGCTVPRVRLLVSVRRTLRWLWSPRSIDTPRSWQHCPICDRELVGGAGGGGPIAGPAGVGDWIPPAKEELIARCPTHGHPPFNVVHR